MTEQTDDQDNTMAAAPAEEPETAVVAADTVGVDGSELAWSVDEPPELAEHRPWTDKRIIAACVVVSAVIVGASIWVWHTVDRHHSATTTVTTAVAKPAPPPTVTVAAPQPTVAVPAPQPTSAAPEDKDSRFIQALRGMGWNPKSVDGAVEAAHQICAGRRAGVSRDQLVRQLYSDEADPSAEDLLNGRYVVDVATRIYCPQYSTE
jgi:hypothetical protein